MMDAAASDALLETIELSRVAFTSHGCPFYDEIGGLLAADVEDGGPIGTLLEPFAFEPFEGAYLIRLLGAVHRLALTGSVPAVAAHFPSTAGDGDASAAVESLRALLGSTPDALGDWSARPPQTNEVGRSAALMSGLLVVADEVGLPISLREIGSSAGLNLRLDHYRYEQDGAGCGDASSNVRFVDLWHGGAPPFGAGLEVVDRRGCDPDPIDASADEGSLALLSYIWPQPPERFDRARAAIAIARDEPVTIDRADARVWLPEQLASRPAGTAFVVMHSVMWQYLPPETQASIRASITGAGRAATAASPVAWVRLEPNVETYVPAELRVTVWDGSTPEPPERLLATTGFHGGELDWVDTAA